MTNFIIIFLFFYLSVKGTSHRYKSHCIEAGTASRSTGHTLVSCRLLMSLKITHTLMPTANIFLTHIAIEVVCVMLEARDKREVRLPFRIKLGPVSSRTFRSLQLLWWRCLAPGFRIGARHIFRTTRGQQRSCKYWAQLFHVGGPSEYNTYLLEAGMRRPWLIVISLARRILRGPYIACANKRGGGKIRLVYLNRFLCVAGMYANSTNVRFEHVILRCLH